MKQITRIALMTTGLVASILPMTANQVQAAIISYDFSVGIDFGPLLGNAYNGSFSYDDGTLNVTALNFPFEGTTYTLADDPTATVAMSGSDFLGLSFAVATSPQPTFVPGFTNVSESSFSYDLNSGVPGNGGTGIITYTPASSPVTTPEPSTLFTLMTLGVLGLKYRKI